MKPRKGSWPTLAEFSYKDNAINISAPIRVKRFSFAIRCCKVHGEERRKDLNVCGICSGELSKVEKSLMMLYINSNSDMNFVKVPEILGRYTRLKWKYQAFRVGQESVRAYAVDLPSAIKSLTAITGQEDWHAGEGVTINIGILPVTDAQLDECQTLYEKNKLLRRL